MASSAKRPNILLPHKYIVPSCLIRIVLRPPGFTEIIFFVVNDVIGEGYGTMFDVVPRPNSPFLFFPQLYKNISFKFNFSFFCFVGVKDIFEFSRDNDFFLFFSLN